MQWKVYETIALKIIPLEAYASFNIVTVWRLDVKRIFTWWFGRCWGKLIVDEKNSINIVYKSYVIGIYQTYDLK
jgi:hypothetical protein